MQTDNTQTTQESNDNLVQYLDNNGLIHKWQETGLLQQAQTNSEKFLISSLMEAMTYRILEMHAKENRSTEDINEFQEKYLTTMRQLGVFDGSLYKQVVS